MTLCVLLGWEWSAVFGSEMLDVLMKCLEELDNEAELLVLCALFSLLNISIFCCCCPIFLLRVELTVLTFFTRFPVVFAFYLITAPPLILVRSRSRCSSKRRQRGKTSSSEKQKQRKGGHCTELPAPFEIITIRHDPKKGRICEERIKQNNSC